MGIASGLGKGLRELSEAVVTKAIPELAERGTAEAPTVLQRAMDRTTRRVGRRGPSVPYLGPEGTEAVATATEIKPKATVTSAVEAVKKHLGGFFMAEPELPKDLRQKAFNTRSREARAQDRIDLLLRDNVFNNLTKEPITQVNHLGTFMYWADEVANADIKSGKTAGGIPLDKANEALAKYTALMQEDPEMQMAHKELRKILDETFDGMVERGLIIPERRRTSYTPILLIEDIAEGLAKMRGEESIGGKQLRATFERSAKHGFRETNIIEIARKYLGEYARKVAEDDYVIDILSDPTLNYTSKFKVGDVIPDDLGVYRPGPGMPGYGNKSVEAYLYDGFVDVVGRKQEANRRAALLTERAAKAEKAGNKAKAKKYMKQANKVMSKDYSKQHVGGFILPKAVAEHLAEFRPNNAKNPMHTAGQFWARQMTVYNPRNTVMNTLSDFPMGLMGMPGEAAHAIGMLRFAPEAYKEAFKGSFGGKSELFDIARAEGLTSGTMLHDVEGRPGSLDFSQFQSADTPPPMQDRLADVMRRTRLAVEAAPRIAGGMAYAEAAGQALPQAKILTLNDAIANMDLNEFGRVGREITLPYGAGAPKHTRYAATRFIAPFLQFIGLASARTLSLATQSGSKARTLAALAAPTTAAMMWNTQSPEFEKVENSLPEWERNQLHFIVKGEDGLPYRDRTGKPVVWRFQYWVPEQVANTFGLGNMPSRIRRIAHGRESWAAQPVEIAGQVVENATRQIGPIRTAIEIGAGRSTLTGQEKDRLESIWGMFPVTRAFAEAIFGVRNEGLGGGARRLAEELSGFGAASITRKGPAVMDADLMEAKREVSEAAKEFQRHKLRKDEARAQDARAKLRKAQERLKEVVKARASEKEARNEQSETE